jgi:putative DNA primase/helicase
MSISTSHEYYGPDTVPPARDALPVVQYGRDNPAFVLSQLEDALIKRGLPVCQWRGKLAEPAIVDVATKYGKGHTVSFVPIAAPHLVELFSSAARFMDAPYGTWRAAAIPERLARLYMQRQPQERKISQALGLTGVPPMRRDSSIWTAPGVDPVTGWFYFPGDMKFSDLDIPPVPSFDDVLDAMEKLRELTKEFPFAGDASFATALSLLITPCIPSLVLKAPLHGVSGNAAGAGKSYLVELAIKLSSGFDAPIIALEGGQSFGPPVYSAALAGRTSINFDNITEGMTLGGPVLAAYLTQPLIEVPRPRAAGGAITLPATAFVTATGINLTMRGDMRRRGLICRLDAAEEDPEERKFKYDPMMMLREDRGAYVAAVLTIMRAYLLAGMPKKDGFALLDGFEEWNDLVAGAIAWAGYGANPHDTMAQVKLMDPEAEVVRTIIGPWFGLFGSTRPITAADVVKILDADNPARLEGLLRLPTHRISQDQLVAQQELKSALQAATHTGNLSPVVVGRTLSRIEGKWSSDRRIVRREGRSKTTFWVMETRGAGAAPAAPNRPLFDEELGHGI